MKKFLVFLLVFVFAMCTVLSAAAPTSELGNEGKDLVKKVKIKNNLNKLREMSEKKNKEFTVEWNEKKGNPSYVVGSLSEKMVSTDAAAVAYLEENQGIFGLDLSNFKVEKSFTDELGTKHYRTTHVVDGIPVYGSEVVLHTDANGEVYAVNGYVESEVPVLKWSKEFKNNTKKAVEEAAVYVGLDKQFNQFASEPTVEKFIYNVNDQWQPVYLVTLHFANPNPASWKVFVNASTNKVVDGFNTVTNAATTGTGVGTKGQTRTLNLDLISGKYYMRDLTRKIETYNMNYSSNQNGLPGTLMYDTDNVFNSAVQAPAVDAQYYLAVTYDYFKNNHGRTSYNNAGATIKTSVHFGSNYNNAFWWNGFFVFGDGDGTQFSPLSGALDVVAHEYAHAVTQYTCNLEYRSQSGALNESMSDVFGYLVEGVASDWQLGEDVTTPNKAGDALRDMQNPTLYGQPAHMSNYMNMPETEAGDWGGVHYNSGIPNKAFYNIATAVNNNTYVGKVYYRALTTYLTAKSQFTDARNALLLAAKDLYGQGGTVYNAIANGFTAVGIGSSSSGLDIYEANDTRATAKGPLVSGTTYNAYIYSTKDVDYYYFDKSASGTITVSLTNLPGDYDVYLLNSSGTTLAKSENGGTTSESISYSGASGRYYVYVVGYNGANSTTQAYALRVTH